MSYKKLRTEKNCLNCGQAVEERFCSHCGQENLQLNDTAFHLMIHYVQDLFHYDGKFWHTLRNLVTKPGLVAKEYLEGKRMQNLEPIRFYVFASTVFFLFLFLSVGMASLEESTNPKNNYTNRLYHLNQEKSHLIGTADTMYINPLIDSIRQKMTGNESDGGDTTNQGLDIELFGAGIDTIQGEGWLEKILLRQLNSKLDELEKTHEGDEFKATKAFFDEVFHKLPQLFFLSLPFFAFFLKLLYWRSSRRLYVEHFIFSIYHYAYMFSILFLYLIFDWCVLKIGGDDTFLASEWITFGLILYPFIYLFLAMKRFYSDRWGTLIIRYFTLVTMLFFTILFLFVLIAVLTFLF